MQTNGRALFPKRSQFSLLSTPHRRLFECPITALIEPVATMRL
jgi:hypothetical protein